MAQRIVQTTLQGDVEFEGIGVHTGQSARMILRPADPDTGINFFRTDLAKLAPIHASADRARELRLGTTLSNEAGQTVATVEHFLAACAGVGLDNVNVEIDGPEVPVMDGSSRVFCEGILKTGLAKQDKPRSVLRILETVRVEDGGSWAVLEPNEAPWLVVDAEIEFDTPAIGRQAISFEMSPGQFADEIGFARTFGFAHEVDALRLQGLARGGSLENAVVIEHDKVLNPEGLRAPDEFVRHKTLDVIGDLMLAGHPIAGRYKAYRPGHAINNKLVRYLLQAQDAWVLEIAKSV